MIIRFRRLLQSAVQMIGAKFLDHLIFGSPDCEDGLWYVSMMEWIEHQ